MEHTITPVAGGKVQITFNLTPEERGKFELRALRQAAADLNVKGFRPGHIPDDVVRKQIGEETLQQETMWQAIKELYLKVVKSLEFDVIGQPNLALQSWEPMVILVTVARLPEVNLGKWEKIKVKRQAIEVPEEEVNKLINQIRDSRASEAAVARGAQLGDRVEMDFDVSLGGITIDGGKQTGYPAVLGSGQLVPGFEDNIVGLKPGEEKKFDITFPSDYRQDLAGKKAQVWAKAKQVFERTLPELTDEFVKGLGKFDSAQDFKAKLKQNLHEEKAAHEEQRVERAMLEEIIKAASFGEIPDSLLANEAETMLHELKHGIEEKGVEWQQYLTSISKDEAALKKEFSGPAERRVKVALAIRTLAKQESLEVDEAAVEQEVARALQHYGSDDRAAAQFNNEDYRGYLKQILTNRRVIEWLKKKLIE